MSDLCTGKWVCEEKGIPTDKLIAACNSGKITAYLSESGQKILASSQCRKKFFFKDRLYFSLMPTNNDAIIAINEHDINNFIIHLGIIKDYSVNNNVCTNKKCMHKTDINRICNETLQIKGNHILYKYLCNNENYLIFFRKKCDISNSNDIFKYTDYIYPTNKFFFEPQSEGEFTFKLLEFDTHNKNQIHQDIKFTIRNIEYEEESKLILENYNDNEISIFYYGIPCANCYVSPLRDKKNQGNFVSKAYNECRRYFHQYKLDYFKPDDTEFNKPLKLRTDFFIFNYNEYCQQNYLQDCDESKRDFYRYIKSLLFDINELKNIFVDDFEDDDILNDPLVYMKLKCFSLLKKYKNYNKDKKVIIAYLISIDTDIPYSELHDIFFPSNSDREPGQKTTHFNKYLHKFEKIAEKNNIPYIQASKFRNINTMEGDMEIRNILKERLVAIRTKIRDKSSRDR